MEMRLQNVASNKVGPSRIHTQKSCLIPSGCPQIRAVFTLSFCLVDQPIMVSVGHNNSTPPPGLSMVAVSSVSPQRREPV